MQASGIRWACMKMCQMSSFSQWIDQLLQSRELRVPISRNCTAGPVRGADRTKGETGTNVGTMIPKRSRRRGDEMASKLVIPILLGVICMLTVVTARENGNFKDSQVISMPTATAEKNISILVIKWGYSYCCPKKEQSCCLSPYLGPDFLIHTIWTINSKREFETNCNGPLFNEKELSAEVIAYSNLYWPSLNCAYNNVGYWKKMWDVYGRCSGLSQSAWFKLAIKLFEPDFTVALLEKGIVPGGKYTQDDFENALSLAVGHKVGVVCNRNSATGELQLYEALICYSPDEKEVIDCGHNNLPSPGENECTGKIALPRKACKPSSFGSCESDA